MVSILAEKAVDFDFTLNLTDGQSFLTIFDNVTFPSFDVSNALGGFTYSESINIVLDMDTIDTDGSNTTLGVNHTALVADFNGIDLLPDQTSGVIESNFVGVDGTPTVDFSGNNLIVTDAYLDTPLNLETSLFSTDNNELQTILGDQTINGNLQIIAIGRQP